MQNKSINQKEFLALFPNTRFRYIHDVNGTTVQGDGTLDMSWNEKGYGIFYTVNGFPPTGKADQSQLVSLNANYVDFDVDTRLSQKEKEVLIQQAIMYGLEAGVPAPTIINRTQKGAHLIWLYTETLAPTPENIEKWRNVQKRLVHCFKGDRAAVDPSRVLRVPYSLHLKDPKNPFEITVMSYKPDARGTLDELDAMVPKSSDSEVVGDKTPAMELLLKGVSVGKGLRHDALFQIAGLFLRGADTPEKVAVARMNYYNWDKKVVGSPERPEERKAELDNIFDGVLKREVSSKDIETNPTKTHEIVLSIEAIDEMMQKIPTDTPKVKLMGALRPILENLIGIEKITAETFILNNVKEHFDLTKEDAKKYVQYLKGLRSKQVSEYKAAKAKEERLPLIIDRDIDSQEVYDAIAEIGIVNEDTLKIITAVVISAQLRLNPPLWLFLIGVPSSFKTELVGLYSAMNEIYTLDTLTENAFASGYVPPDGSETQDLLPLLDNKAFVIKDLNTLFSMNEEMVKKILGDLTSIFDGKFQKFTATRGMIEYSALFSMIGCVTPSILIKHYNYATALGPRFFFLRLPDLTEAETQAGFEKSWNETDRKGKIIKARQIVSSYCTQLISKIKKHKYGRETKEIQENINRIAQFICKARGIAITRKSTFENEKGKSVEFYEIIDWQVEQPWRILNQIKHLLRILSFINGTSTVSNEEIKILRPIILSTMPVDRAEVLSILVVKSGLSCKELAREIQKSTKTVQRTMKELEALGITDCCKDPKFNRAGKAPWLYFISQEFSGVLNSPIPSPEFLSLSKSVIGETVSDDDEEVEDDTDELLASIPPAEAGNQEVADGTLINNELEF